MRQMLGYLLSSFCLAGFVVSAVAETKTPGGDLRLDPPPKKPVSESRPVYGRSGKEEIRGLLVRPKESGKPVKGLILFHGAFGLNERTSSLARRLAGEGYTVLAVDLFHGLTTNNMDSAKLLMAQAEKESGPVKKNIEAAYHYLAGQAKASKIGVMGMSFGGGMAVKAAGYLRNEIDALVVYYGKLVFDKQEVRKLTMPFFGAFAEKDLAISAADVRLFERNLKKVNDRCEFHYYRGVRHEFANPSRLTYDAKASEDAWEKNMRFLQMALGGGHRATH